MKEEKKLKESEYKNEEQELESIEASKILGVANSTSNNEEIEAKYYCTIKQFAYFVDGTESKQKAIINGQKNPPEEPFFWYQRAESSIRRSLKSGNHVPIYEGISNIKKLVVEGKHKKLNNQLSILALEKYLKIALPMEFSSINKTAIRLDINKYRYFGVEIKITPDFVFRAEYKGKKIIGGVRVNFGKTRPFNDLRMKVVSFLLSKFLQKHIAKDDEIVMPQFCLCIDVFRGKCISAPSGTDIPYAVLKIACEEYAKKWDSQ